MAFKSNMFVGSSSKRRSGLNRNINNENRYIYRENIYFEKRARANARRILQPPENCLLKNQNKILKK